MMIKTILYIAFKYEYGKKENGLALNYKAWYESFLALGYEVETIFYEEYTKEALQKKILDFSIINDPDMIFFILQSDHIETSTLIKLKEKKYFTVNFFGDDQWRFESFSSKYANYFSACITTDKYSIEKYQNIGQKNIIRSQWASLESSINYSNKNYKYDVSFIGGVSRYRKWFINALDKKGVKVHCFGNGWENGRVTYEEMEEIFASTKINLNISNSTSYDIRYLTSSLKNIMAFIKSIFKSGKNSSQTKARNFEIPTQGGFQLTDFVPSLDDYFDIGKEVACYSCFDEVELLINYYLKNQNEREIIKFAGIKKARSKHTFKHRTINFMQRLEKMKVKYES